MTAKFKNGDIVKIRPEMSHCSWYSEDEFLLIIDKDPNGVYKTKFIFDKDGGTGIREEYIYFISNTYMRRKDKLKTIIKDSINI